MQVHCRGKKIKITYNVFHDYCFLLKDFKSLSVYILGKDVLKLNENQADIKRKKLGEFTQHKPQRLKV